MSDKKYHIKGREVDDPLLMIKVKCNTSPFAGKEAERFSFGHLKSRLEKESGIDAALKISVQSSEIFVYGRGD